MACSLLLVVAVLESWILSNWPWLQFAALAAILVGAMASGPASHDENRLRRAIERYPFLKLWFVLCAVAALGFAAATTVWHVPLNEHFGVRGLLALFAIFLGPLIVAIEREKFEAAGNEP